MSFKRRTLVAAMTLVAACGPGATERPLTYEEFVALVYVEPATGVMIVNGDETVGSESELQELYRRYLNEEFNARALSPVDSYSIAQVSQPLIVNTVNGIDDRWAPSQSLVLTYCIDVRSMYDNYPSDPQGATRYNATIAAMNQAAAAWEAVAAVRYVYSSQFDNNCTATTNVVFDVHRVTGQSYLARSFFPSNARAIRNLNVDNGAFGAIAPLTLAGLLRHELGHSIGFRHEHIRPEAHAPNCQETNNWRALTIYDAASVMHYPQCNGTNHGDLILTNLDQQGATALYARGSYPRLDNNPNDPDSQFSLNQTIAFTGTSETTGYQGPYVPVAGSPRSLNRGPDGGPTTLTFNATWNFPTGFSWMRLDVRFVVDGAVVFTQRVQLRGNVALAPVLNIAAGVHDVWVETRSVLSQGPPISVTVTGTPAVINATW